MDTYNNNARNHISYQIRTVQVKRMNIVISTFIHTTDVKSSEIKFAW